MVVLGRNMVRSFAIKASRFFLSLYARIIFRRTRLEALEIFRDFDQKKKTDI